MKTFTYIIFILPILYLIYLLFLYSRVKVPFVIIDKKYVVKIFDKVKISDQTIIYDLGSGKGDFLFATEKFNPKELVGYELSSLHVLFSKIKAKLIGSKIKFIRKDFFSANISNADMIYLFLIESVVAKIWEKIKKECKTGTKVIVLGDKIENEKEIQIIDLDPGNTKSSKVRVYQV
ncbi:MAG: methyltransferase [Candidatus Kerfeldbacteria bacterium]|jgi:ribosomal protein L11 methylase PrmA